MLTIDCVCKEILHKLNKEELLTEITENNLPPNTYYTADYELIDFDLIFDKSLCLDEFNKLVLDNLIEKLTNKLLLIDRGFPAKNFIFLLPDIKNHINYHNMSFGKFSILVEDDIYHTPSRELKLKVILKIAFSHNGKYKCP